MIVLVPLGARAETVYVVDRLLLGVHETKTLNSAIIKLLPSGTRLEVLERDESLARVRSPEGFEGWVEASYLTTEEPASLIVDNLRRLLADGTREMERARQIIGELEAEVAAVTARAERAEAALADGRGSAPAERPAPSRPDDRPQLQAELQAEIERLVAENTRLQQSLRGLEGELAAAAGAPAPAPAPPPSAGDSHRAGPAQQNEPLRYALRLMRVPWTWVAVGAALALAFAAGVWLTDWNQRRRHGGFRV